MIALALLIAGAEVPRLARGTPVVLATVAPISSRTAAKGDRVTLTVAEAVVRDGAVLVPVGADAIGELTRAEPKAAFGKAGRVEVRLLYLMVNGRAVRISGRLDARPRASTRVPAAGLGIGALAFVVTGRSAVIPAGTRVVAEVMSDFGVAR